jgi:polyphenol oxidase
LLARLGGTSLILSFPSPTWSLEGPPEGGPENFTALPYTLGVSMADVLSEPGVVRIPAWAEYRWLQAGFSTRQGGRTAAYGAPGEQNLGFTKEDAPSIVTENRRMFLESVQGEGNLPLLTIAQIHSGTICTVEDGAERAAQDLMTPDGKPVLRGDGLMTRNPGLMLGIVTADCVPVLLADTRTHAVAAFHAGWRGTLARIVGHGVDGMRIQFGSAPEDLIAAIGPAIGPCCFEVGSEVQSEFYGVFSYASELFSRGPERSTLSLDLIEANRRQLLWAGVAADRISGVGDCTACTRMENGRRKYFSHRAERGVTGRMLSVIGAVI